MPFPRTLALSLMLAFLSGAPASAATSVYRIDQRYGTIAFSVTSLGLFSTEGRFRRFQGELLLDPEHPERTHVEVAIDANSVDMPLANEEDMLRSAGYFDVARYPRAHFASTSVEALSPNHYRVHGTLRIRGVTDPIDLDAVVTHRHFDQARQIEVADFDVTGKLRRSAFGMRADQMMVSDIVGLRIHIHITVPLAPRAG